MKKFIIVSLALFCSLVSFAQMKGEKYLSGNIGTSCGTQSVTMSEGSYSSSASQPLDASFAIGAEFGYFVADNLKVGLSLSLPHTSSPTYEEDGKWLKNSTMGVNINPNVAYYIKLADRFYYTPEAGASFGVGNYKQKLTSEETYKSGYWEWNIYLSYAAFEFRINRQFALGINVGALSYGSATIFDKESDASIGTGQFKFDLNSADVSFKFYF